MFSLLGLSAAWVLVRAQDKGYSRDADGSFGQTVQQLGEKLTALRATPASAVAQSVTTARSEFVTARSPAQPVAASDSSQGEFIATQLRTQPATASDISQGEFSGAQLQAQPRSASGNSQDEFGGAQLLAQPKSASGNWHGEGGQFATGSDSIRSC